MAIRPMSALLLSLVAAAAVQTPSGPVRGVDTGNVTAFYRVPYAQPPVGDLRFAPPRPVRNWTAEFNATRVPTEDDMCPQIPPLGGNKTVLGKEDCLTLDVYTPDVAGAAPVMLWIHGGQWTYGSSYADYSDLLTGQVSPVYDGHQLARKYGVVVVSINYRMGVLGWLGLKALAAEPGSGNATGNYGLQDQQLAMQWVQNNIAAFGGDPAKVTLFGQSAGAMAICYHLVMPDSAGLFAGAIMSSSICNGNGVDFPLALKEETITAAEKNGTCAPDESLIACLRSKPVDDLVSYPFLASISGPTVDGLIIPMRFAESLRAGAINRVPIIIGSNRYDGAVGSANETEAIEIDGFWSPEMEANPNAEREKLEDLISAASGRAIVFADAQWEQVEAEYPLEAYKSRADRMHFLVTHAAFSNGTSATQTWIGHCGTEIAASEWAKFSGQDAWVYSFDALDERHDFIKHAEDVPLVWQNAEAAAANPMTTASLNATAAKGIAEVFGTYYTQFAKAQDPNTPQLPAWTSYTGAPPLDEVLIIKGTTPSFAAPPYRGKCQFWQRLLGGESRRAATARPLLSRGKTRV